MPTLDELLVKIDASTELLRRELKKGDTLVIAGKGHETGQIIGADILPFSDQDEALAALREMDR